MEARALLEQQGDELERLRQQALERDLWSDRRHTLWSDP
jgi:hypothetical protein